MVRSNKPRLSLSRRQFLRAAGLASGALLAACAASRRAAGRYFRSPGWRGNCRAYNSKQCRWQRSRFAMG